MNTQDEPIYHGSVVECSTLTLEQVAVVCTVDPQWLLHRIGDGLIPQVEQVGETWCFSALAIQRARRMHHVERDFDAVPELAALMADLLEEMDGMRARLRKAGLG
jgi:chaperone modulatory protein CbpM